MFKKLVESITPENRGKPFDLYAWLGLHSPTVGDNIPMGKFDADLVFDSVIKNLDRNPTKPSKFVTTSILLDLKSLYDELREDEKNLSKRLAAQLLVHISNLNTIELSVSLEGQLINYIELSRQIKADYICPMPNNSADQLKKFLSNKSVIESFQLALERFEFSDVSCDRITKTISAMTIYQTGEAGYGTARGWNVTDGIVIATPKYLSDTVFCQKAKQFTVARHVTSHFLASTFSNNFNFLIPKTNDGTVMYEDGDFAHVQKKNRKALELGRQTEIILFGKQVEWDLTPPELAERLISRLEDGADKLLLEDEKNLLQAREYPTCSSGVYFDGGDLQNFE